MIPECPATVDEAVEAAVDAIRPRHYEIWDYTHEGVTRFQVLQMDRWGVVAENFKMSHASWQANFRAGKLRFVV